MLTLRAHLDLNGVPYVVYGVKYIDLVSLCALCRFTYRYNLFEHIGQHSSFPGQPTTVACIMPASCPHMRCIVPPKCIGLVYLAPVLYVQARPVSMILTPCPYDPIKPGQSLP